MKFFKNKKHKEDKEDKRNNQALYAFVALLMFYEMLILFFLVKN